MPAVQQWSTLHARLARILADDDDDDGFNIDGK